jgi:outer membrane protein, heavy metal efflux system
MVISRPSSALEDSVKSIFFSRRQWAVLFLTVVWCYPGPSSADSQRGKKSDLSIMSSEQSSEQSAVTLDELLQEAAANNPAIKAAQQTASAKKSLVLPAKTLPDPTITFWHLGGLFPTRLMVGDPSSARTYGIEQDIPFPGKLGLRGKVASMEAEVEEWNHALTHHQVIADLKQAYYDLYLFHKSKELLRKNQDLLQSFEKIAETRYQVGQGNQQDVLKAQVEIAKLIDRSAILDQRGWIAEAQINNLLFRPPDALVGMPAEYKKAELTYSLEDLTELARANSPTLKIQEREIDRKQYSLDLAKKEYFPDFTVGFTTFEREGNPQMYGVEAKARIPLYFWRKQKPEVDAAKANLAGAQRMRESTSSSVNFQIKQSYTVATTSDKLVRLYSGSIIPQATFSLRSAVASYETGKVGFLSVVDSATALLEYQLKYYESMNEFQKALAQMEPLVGVDLTR